MSCRLGPVMARRRAPFPAVARLARRRPMPQPLDALNRFVISVMRMIYGKEIMKKLA